MLAAPVQPDYLGWHCWGLASAVVSLLDRALFPRAKSEVPHSLQGYWKSRADKLEHKTLDGNWAVCVPPQLVTVLLGWRDTITRETLRNRLIGTCLLFQRFNPFSSCMELDSRQPWCCGNSWELHILICRQREVWGGGAVSTLGLAWASKPSKPTPPGTHFSSKGTPTHMHATRPRLLILLM